VSAKYLQKKSLGTVWYRQKISVAVADCASRGRPARSTGGHSNWHAGTLVVVVVVVGVVVVVELELVGLELVVVELVVVVPPPRSDGTQNRGRCDRRTSLSDPNWSLSQTFSVPKGALPRAW
jgi:hypothetical protein